MLRGLIICLSLLFATLAFADAQDDAKQHMKTGVKLLNAKKFTEAILSFQRALDVLPDASGPHREMGKCYQKLGKYDEALDHYTEYLTRKPEAQERAEIEQNIALSRQKLSTQGRAILSLQTTPPGASVYALTDKGERRGLGVSPIVEHPLELRFTHVFVVVSGRPPVDAALSLKEGETSSLSLDIPEKAPEPTPLVNNTDPSPINPTSEPTLIEAVFVAQQTSLAALRKIETVEEQRQERPITAYALLGVSGAAAITGAALAVGFFQTTGEMKNKIAALNDANEAQLLSELAALDEKAHKKALLIDVSAGASLLSAAAGTALLLQFRSFSKSSSLVQITPLPNGISIGAHF